MDSAWETTTGSPDTVIAITDSGIEWCDTGVVDKIALNRKALPYPENSQGLTKPQLEAEGVSFADSDPYDLDNSGVFNVAQYANDPRVEQITGESISKGYFCGSFISPEDLIRTFGSPTIDVTTTAAQAIAYANARGVPVISSAADEEAEHHNEPADLPGTIVVNSTTQGLSEGSTPLYNPPSYLYLNGCTNYGANIAVTVESSSCSSEATGKTGGITGLLESEARTLMDEGKLAAYPGVTNALGQPVALSTTEVRELIEMAADQIDFQTPVVPTASDASTTLAEPPDNNAVVAPYPTTRYPSQPGYDMYTGYGRIDANNILTWLAEGKIPPEASFGEMQWFQTYDPTSQSIQVPLFAAAVRTPGTYTWELQYGIGTQPVQDDWTDITGGSGEGGLHGTPLDTTVTLPPALLQAIAAQLPASDNGTGPDGQPDSDADSFTLRLVVTDSHGLVGMDRRTEYLDHDPTLLTSSVVQPTASGPGASSVDQLATSIGGSIDAAPTLAPIGPGGENALIVPTSDGTIHAYVPVPEPGGGTGLEDLPGWPAYTEELPGQAEITANEKAYTSGAVTAIPHCEIVGGVAVGNLTGAGPPDVMASDMCGYVYAWNSKGQLLPGFPVHTDPAYSQDPAPYAGTDSALASDPSVDPRDPDNRLLPGILGAPALADLGGGQLDIIVSLLDRHVYAWTAAGKPVPGYPVLVVDPSVVQSVDPVSNHVAFKSSVNVQMGSMILDTPAIGNLSGSSGPPDLVIGTDEEYGCNPATVPDANLQEDSGEPDCAISDSNTVDYGLGALGGGAGLLNPANSELYALAPSGTDTPSSGSGGCADGTAQPDACAILPGWPAQMTDLDAGLLPDVADGTTATPALADLTGDGPLDVGDMTSVGPAYIFTPTGTSYLGDGPNGEPNTLAMTDAGPAANSHDLPSIPALGMPVFASLGTGAPGISFVAPAASLGKALDAALPAEQYGNDNQIDAWDTSTATMQAAFPQVMNDLQFFDQPLVADVGGASAGSYIVDASATSDIRAVNAEGQEAPGFPKFTGGWVVNSPSFGAFGPLSDQVLVAGTRDDDLFVWSTPTPRCASSGPWPREHHDLSNTDDLDATGASAFSCSATDTGGSASASKE